MKFAFSTVLTIAYFLSFAQDFDVKWSSQLKHSSTQSYLEVINTSDSGYCVVQQDIDTPGKLTVNLFDSLLTSISVEEVSIPCTKIVGTYNINGKLTIFAASAEGNTDILTAYSLNNKGQLSGTVPISKQTSNGGYRNTFEVSVSPNGKKVGVIIEKPYYKEKNDAIIATIYDQNLEEKTNKEISFHFPSTKRKINVPVINDKGELYIIKRTRIKSANKYFVCLVSGAVNEQQELKLRNRNIADLGYKLREDGSLVLSGFFTSPVRFNFEGVFAAHFNSSVSPTFKKEYYLPENIVGAFKSKKEISKSGHGLDKFHVKEVLLSENDNIYLIAEHISVSKEAGVGNENRDGIVAIKFSKVGDYMYGAPILSNQADEQHNGYWNSHFATTNGSNLLIGYNEIGYFDKKADNDFGNNAFAGVRTVKLSPAGHPTTSPMKGVFNEAPEKVSMYMKDYHLQENNTIIIAESPDHSRFYLGKITWD